jgi:uncharacterized protein YjbI with pentapeptide repeats
VTFDENDGLFNNVSFVDCTFEHCTFSAAVFNQTYFTGCKFIDCVASHKALPGQSIHFFGCEDYHSGFISGFVIAPVIAEGEDMEPMEIRILSRYFKSGGRRPRMKYVSQLRSEFEEAQLDEVSSVFERLRKDRYILVKGNNSFITQSGINYYHKHSNE